jgi:HEAT repeat protein
MTIGKAVSILRSAIVNARIYPKGSQMIESSLKGAMQALETCLQETTPIILSDVQGKFCINGKESVEAKDFRPFLVQHEVQSLKILKGLTLAEVAALLEGLGKRKGQLEGQKTLSEWLAAQGVTHVQVEEIEFVELKKGEVVVQQVLSLLEQSTGDVPTLVNSLEESFRMIDQLPEEAARKDVQKKMASQLASSMAPQQLREFFDSKLPDRIGNSSLRDDIAQAMSRDKLEETLEEVHRWYQQIKQETKSELEVVEKLNGLKGFLGKILHSPASKTVPFALYEELLNVGLIDQMPAGVQKGENAGLLAEVEHLVNEKSEALLEPAVRQRFPELLKAMCAMGLDGPLQKLTDKMLDNLHNPAPLVRETAAKVIRVFQETLASNRKEKPFLQIVSTLHVRADSESAPDVYGQIAESLQLAAMELLVNWKFEESALLLATLRRHSREESPIGHKKKQLAVKALLDFSTRGLDVICADLNAPLKDRQNGAYRILAELGEEAVGPLVEAVKRSSDLRSRQAAIQAMKHLGATVKNSLLKQLNVEMSADVLIKLIPVLEDFADASLLPTLSALLQHPDAGVRRQVAQLLAKVNDPKVQNLLTGLLDDADVDVQAEAVRLIGELHLKQACPELARRLSAVSPVVQEEMCVAFGHLGEKSVIPDLIKILQTQKSFWRRVPGTTDSVRARALWALGQLLPDEAAQKTLTRALKDPNPNIRRTAQNALGRLTIPATKSPQ